jgi:hypothetical protein
MMGSNVKTTWIRALIFLIIIAITVFSWGIYPATAQTTGSVLAENMDAKVAQDWMRLLYDRVQAETVNAPAASRIYAYAGITLYEAVVPGIPGNNSLSGQLNDMPDMPLIEDNVIYDWASTANAALATVIDGLFTKATADTHKAVADVRKKQAIERRQVVGDAVVTRSLAYGDSVGKAILEWASTDGYTDTRTMTFEMPIADNPDSLWVPTTASQNKPIEPFWGNIRSFALEEQSACNVRLNMEFSTDPESAFYAQAVEVKKVKDNLTADQKAIAQFWVDTPGITGAPSGHWVSIETQLVDQLHLKLDRAAGMYALVGWRWLTHLSHAGISSIRSCWCAPKPTSRSTFSGVGHPSSRLRRSPNIRLGIRWLLALPPKC